MLALSSGQHTLSLRAALRAPCTHHTGRYSGLQTREARSSAGTGGRKSTRTADRLSALDSDRCALSTAQSVTSATAPTNTFGIAGSNRSLGHAKACDDAVRGRALG